MGVRARLGRTWYNLHDYVARADTGEGVAVYNERMSQLVFQVVDCAPV
jgi:hypothetical protein